MKLWAKYHLNIPREGEGAGGGAAGAGGEQQQGQQQQTKPWYEGKADAEIIGTWQNNGWDKDPVTAAIEATKSFRELQKYTGVPADQLLRLPKDAADEAGWNGVYRRLGVPDDAKAYDLSTIKHADGRDVDPALTDALRASMLTARVPKDRAGEIAKAVVKSLDGQAAAKASESAAALATEKTKLEESWGKAGSPTHEFNKLTAQQAIRRLGVEPEVVAKLESVAGYAKVMELFRKVGAGTTEATFHEGGGGVGPTTREGAAARKAELESDPAWRGRYLAGGVAERREMDNLLQQISGAAA